MTESTYKKNKDRRYHIKSNVEETDPVFEPLTDLDDDEDAIDRLLVNTGFDRDEDISAPMASQDKLLTVYTDLVFEPDAFSDDEVLFTLKNQADDDIEPADLGSPIADIDPLQDETIFAGDESLAVRHDPVPVEDGRFSTLNNHTAQVNDSILDRFIPPGDADETIEAVDRVSPVSGFAPTEAPNMDFASCEDHDALFDQPATAIELQTDPVPMWQSPWDDAFANTMPAEATDESAGDDDSAEGTASRQTSFVQDIHPDIAPIPIDWGRLLSMQEDTRQQMAQLEEKARKAGHLSYAALGLSVTALCVGLTAGYLNFQTRAEQTKLKEMQTVFEEDMNSLNEKFDSNNQAAEDSAETSSSLADESIIIPRKNPIAVDEALPPNTESTQAAVKPAPGIAGKKIAALPMRKGVPHQSKPALKTASRKPSRNPSANETEANWTVNLASFKQIQEARKKAAEFRKKGISVKVTKVDIKRATWYRLSVSGFKTRQAASTQSTRLKKLLRLNSIWVAAI